MSWNDQTPKVVSVSQDGTLGIPQSLAPPQVHAVSIPQDVTYAMETLRSACANWNGPTPVQAATEVSVCNVALSRHVDAVNGATVGIAGTLLAVVWINLCRSSVRAKTINRIEDRLAYAMCAGLGALTAAFFIALDLAVSINPLEGPTLRWVWRGAAIIGALTLPAVRWLRQMEIRRAAAAMAGE